jgi:hypothetical protein
VHHKELVECGAQIHEDRGGLWLKLNTNDAAAGRDAVVFGNGGISFVGPPLVRWSWSASSALEALVAEGKKCAHTYKVGLVCVTTSPIWMAHEWVRIFSVTLLVQQGWSHLIRLCPPTITPSG